MNEQQALRKAWRELSAPDKAKSIWQWVAEISLLVNILAITLLVTT